MKDLLNKLKLNEEGSSGGLAGFVLNFVFFSGMCIILGSAMDIFVATNNSFIGTMALSQDAINTMGFISMIFKALPFIFLIFLVINHLVISNKDSSGEV